MTKPNPGSDAAIALGCSCPVLDNDYGTGQDGLFWYNESCPVHPGKFCVDGVAHGVGDPQCPKCYGDWPKSCACGGLIHRAWRSDADDVGSGSWYEFFDILRCDRCDDLRI